MMADPPPAAVPYPSIHEVGAVLDRFRLSSTATAKARCPAHDDRSPSLSLKVGDGGKLLLKCFAGCEYSAIKAALEERGLVFPHAMANADPFPGKRPSERRAAPAPTAEEYDWTSSSAINDTEYPCDICGRVTDCEPCEHCSFTFGEALRMVLYGRDHGEVLAAARRLARSDDWGGDAVVVGRVRHQLRKLFGAAAETAVLDQPVSGPLFKVYNAADVDFEPVEWLWPGRIERGETTLLAGRAGVGKGMVAAAVCSSVSTGRALPGASSSDAADCAWIRGPGEDSVTRLRGRLEAAGADLARVALVDVDAVPGALVAAVRDRADAGAAVIVIDSLSVFAMADNLETIDASAVRRWLMEIRAAGGKATLLPIAHHNKMTGAGDGDRVSGSHQFTASVRGFLTIDSDDDPGAAPNSKVIRTGKTNNGVEGPDVRFAIVSAENGDGAVAWAGIGDRPGPGDSSSGKVAEVVKIVSDYGEPVTARQVRDHLGVKNAAQRRAMKTALDSAVREGVLETVPVMRGSGKGREWVGYQLADRPADLPMGPHGAPVGQPMGPMGMGHGAGPFRGPAHPMPHACVSDNGGAPCPMPRALEHRIGDNRVLRLITKWLNAGVMEDGEWKDDLQGTPQGAVVSPILANVYLHYVFDLWFQKKWRARKATGDTIIVRYADDCAPRRRRREAEMAALVCSHAARGMRAGPSEPPGRGRLQTAVRCFGQEPGW